VPAIETARIAQSHLAADTSIFDLHCASFFKRRHTATRSVLRFVGRLTASRSHEVAVITAHADQMKMYCKYYLTTSGLLCL